VQVGKYAYVVYTRAVISWRVWEVAFW
jgi:hypothetical protein